MSSAVLTRSNRLKTATRGEAIYNFAVSTPRPFAMDGINRAFLQVLQTLGRTTEQEVTLSNTSDMGYIMGNIYTSASDGGVNIVGQAFNVANNCSFRVKCLNLPNYTLYPGKYFQFDGDFQFVEVIL